MGRLVSAVLILFAVLIGLRFCDSSPFQQNVSANRLDTAAQDTRNTGFAADSTGASPETSGALPSNSTQSFNTRPIGSTPTGTTPLPPATSPATSPVVSGSLW